MASASSTRSSADVQESNPFDKFDDPDVQVRAIGELFGKAAEGHDVAGNAMTGLRMIVEASNARLTGASSHVVDLALVSIALSVERIAQHFTDDISAADVDAGLRSAGGILRTFAMAPDDADQPSSEEFLIWLDLVPILLSQMIGALHWQRIRARGHAHASAISRLATPAVTKH